MFFQGPGQDAYCQDKYTLKCYSPNDTAGGCVQCMQDPKVADTTPTTTPSVTSTTTTASTTIATAIGNTDCVEQQSVCTAACERAGSRQYQVLRNQTKLGRACIGPSDCQPGEDACSTTASTSTAITRTGTSTSATTPTATTTTVARPHARPFDCNAHPSPIQILGVGRNAAT